MWEDGNNLGQNIIWLTRPVAANNTDVMSSNSNQYSGESGDKEQPS